MTSRTASRDDMEELHNAVAREITSVISKGVPVLDDGQLVRDEDGEIVRAPASPAFFAAAIKFLKDNNVTAILTPGSPMEGLVKSLPEFEDDEDAAYSRH